MPERAQPCAAVHSPQASQGPWPAEDDFGGDSSIISLYDSDLAFFQAREWHVGNPKEDFKGKEGSGKVKSSVTGLP